MATIPGSVRVGGFIAPTDSLDTYAVTDDIYGRGGYRPVADIAERDAITADRRKEGMLVRTNSTGQFWTLIGGILNANWTEVEFGVQIDDLATGSTTVTWSVNRIEGYVSGRIDTLIGGAGAALDTLEELANALGNDPSFATTIATSIANRVRFDAPQSLTPTQQLQACTNIGVGDYDRNLVTVYETAKL